MSCYWYTTLINSGMAKEEKIIQKPRNIRYVAQGNVELENPPAGPEC